MKKTHSKKYTKADFPKYHMVIPYMICSYMILSLFFVGIDNKLSLLCITAMGTVMWFVGEKIFPDKVYIDSIKVHNRYIYGLVGIVLIMTLLSEIFADDYTSSNLRGESDSIYAIVCYIVLFYMTYRYFYMDKSQMLMKHTIVCMAVVTVVMSVMEFYDFPVASWWVGEGIVLADRNRVALSFGNSNYYGVFCCMLLVFVMELWLHKKEILKKILFIALSGCLVCCVLMSKSTTAAYLMILAVIGICLYEFKIILKQWLYIIGFAGVLALIVVLLNVSSSNKLFNLVMVTLDNADAFKEEDQKLYEISDISLEGNRLVIKGVGSSLIAEYDEQFTFYDENNDILDIESHGNTITFTDEPYNSIAIDVSYNQAVRMIYLEVDAGYKETIDFYISNGEFKGVGADGGAVDDIGGKIKEYRLGSLFTGRGYIWANTVPMLDEVILIGKGPGNFVHNFKQYDYVGLLKTQGTHNVIISRPHNMFLQYSMDIGIVGAVAVFGLMVYVLIAWIKQRVKYGRDDNILSVSSFVSVVALMIFLLLNDSLVIISPYLWILLGMNKSFHSIDIEK